MTTLLITTHNRAGLLRISLERLADLTKPDEVLVIDDGGSDETEGVCAELSDRLPVRYVYHDNPGATICSQARNVGVRLAASDTIVTCEPEIVFVTDVLAQLLALHDEHPRCVVSAGRIHHAQGAQSWQDAAALPPTAIGWVAPYAALYKRSWIARVGGWDESFPGPWGWDDTDLLTRLRLSGIGQRIAVDIEAVHLWHGLGGDPDSVNEQHFFAKSFNGDENNHRDVVANKGIVWGTHRTRSS